MTENEEVSDKTFLKTMLRKYEKLLIVLIIVGLILFIGVFFVLYGFIELSPIGLNGEATFDQWTLKGVIVFSIQIILWELLIIGVRYDNIDFRSKILINMKIGVLDYE